MTTLQEKCLLILAQKAKSTPDMYLINIQLPVQSKEELISICEYLSEHGFISKVDVRGWDYIACQVEEKALIRAVDFNKENPHYTLDTEE